MRSLLASSLALVATLLASTTHAAVIPLQPGWTARTIVSGIPALLPNALVVDPATRDLYAITFGNPDNTPVVLRRIAPDGTVTTLVQVSYFAAGTLKFDPFARVLYWSGGNNVIEQRDLSGSLLGTIPWPPSDLPYPVPGAPIAVGPDHQLHALTDAVVGGLNVARIVRYDPVPGTWTPERDVTLPPPFDHDGLPRFGPVTFQLDDAGRAFIGVGGCIMRADGGGITQLGQLLLVGDLAVESGMAITVGQLYSPSGGFQGSGTAFVSGADLTVLAISPDGTVFVVDVADPTSDQNKSIVALSQHAVPTLRATWGVLKSRFH